MEDQDWTGLQAALRDLDFPADSDEIVAHVLEYTSEAGVLRLARSLPPETYRNMSEVRSSVSLDPAAEEGRTLAQKAAQARSHNKHTKHVAEYLRDVPDTTLR